MKRKLKGFTLLEMMITMVLSSLVIGFAYFGINYIFSSFVNFQKVNTSLEEYCQLQQRFTSLFYDAKEIRKEGNVIFFTKKDDSVIKSTPGDNCIVLQKEDVVLDTLKVNYSEISGYWFDEENVITSGYINKLNIKLTLGGQEINPYFQKNYDAVMLMHLDSLQKNNRFE